jgi:hypothetical protein
MYIQYATTVDVENNKYYIFYVRVCVASVTQHSKHMYLIMLSSVDRPALPYISTISHTWENFLKKVTEYKLCVLIFSTTFV